MNHNHGVAGSIPASATIAARQLKNIGSAKVKVGRYKAQKQHKNLKHRGLQYISGDVVKWSNTSVCLTDTRGFESRRPRYILDSPSRSMASALQAETTLVRIQDRVL